MAQEIGESREAWGLDCLKLVEDFAKGIKSDKPFYIVYCAKYDPHASKDNECGVFRQTVKAYYSRPPKLLGVLVWFANKRTGELQFVPELSSPPDIPLDPLLLSNESSDFSERVADQAQHVGVLSKCQVNYLVVRKIGLYRPSPGQGKLCR